MYVQGDLLLVIVAVNPSFFLGHLVIFLINFNKEFLEICKLSFKVLLDKDFNYVKPQDWIKRKIGLRKRLDSVLLN